ncbi:hypothetical protein QBC36DRAFT_169672, partial [Triangularia setosa]
PDFPENSDDEDSDTEPIPTIERIQELMNQWSRPHGYAVTRMQGRMKKQGQYTRYTLVCDRYGQRRPSNAKSRSTSSRKCGCNFKLTAWQKRPGKWLLKNHED